MRSTTSVLIATLFAACVAPVSSPPPQYGQAGQPPHGGQDGYGDPNYGGPPPQGDPNHGGPPPPRGGGGYGGGRPPRGCGSGNIAFAKPARQSSASQWSTSRDNDASGGVDGKKTGGFGFHTSHEAQPWWEVDLGQMCELGQIVIFNRLDCCRERATSLRVLGYDGRDWQVLYMNNGTPFGGVTDNRPLVINVAGRSASVVRIQLTASGNEYLHFDEVEIYGAGGSVATGPATPPSGPPPVASCGSGNIALGGQARQSSNSQWSKQGNDAQGGIDGKKTGGFGFHTSHESQPWWEVDLGRLCPLRTLRIYNRMDCCGTRAASLQVSVSNGRDWQVVYRHDGSAFGGSTDGRPLVVDLGGRPGQVVRLQLTAPGVEYLHFDEVEIESR